MKILHLISSNGLYGAERVVLNLAGDKNVDTVVGAVKNQHNPHLEIIDEAKRLGLKTAVFESSGRFDFKAISEVAKFICENKIDILHTHNYKSDIVGLLAARAAKSPIIATAHGFTGASRAVNFYESVDRFILKKFFCRVIVVNEDVFPGLLKKDIIANGIDLQMFNSEASGRDEFRKKFGINENDIVIGTIGRLSREKNQMLFLKAARDILQTRKDMKFVIVGDGPEERTLKAFVRQNNMDGNVIFTGLIKNVVPVYKSFHIFVLTSTTEGVPLTILEAMASKVPVVATRVGGIGQMIQHQKTGLLIDSGDVKGLVGCINRLSNEPLTVKMMIDQAYIHVAKEFSIDTMQAKYRKVYEGVLDARLSADRQTCAGMTKKNDSYS